MKKILLICSVIGLCACANTTTEESNGITKLNAEPKDCQYSHSINTTMTSYKISDAYDFLEKQIIEDGLGDTYYIVSEDILENEDAVFGPKHSFKLKAKVYKCEK